MRFNLAPSLPFTDWVNRAEGLVSFVLTGKLQQTYRDSTIICLVDKYDGAQGHIYSDAARISHAHTESSSTTPILV